MIMFLEFSIKGYLGPPLKLNTWTHNVQFD